MLLSVPLFYRLQAFTTNLAQEMEKLNRPVRLHVAKGEAGKTCNAKTIVKHVDCRWLLLNGFCLDNHMTIICSHSWITSFPWRSKFYIVSCSFLYPSTLHTFQAETQSEPLHPRSIRRSICFTSNTRTLGPTSARAREKLCIPSKGSKIILWNHSICGEILMETWHCPANPAASSSFSNGR